MKSGKSDDEKASLVVYVVFAVHFLVCVVITLWFLDQVSQAIYAPPIIYPLG